MLRVSVFKALYIQQIDERFYSCEQGGVAADDHTWRREHREFCRRVRAYLIRLTVQVLRFIHSLMVNDDIDAIIQRGEERTAVLNSKYEGLTFEDLSNFKSEASVQQWEGEDFRPGVSYSAICH